MLEDAEAKEVKTDVPTFLKFDEITIQKALYDVIEADCKATRAGSSTYELFDARCVRTDQFDEGIRTVDDRKVVYVTAKMILESEKSYAQETIYYRIFYVHDSNSFIVKQKYDLGKSPPSIYNAVMHYADFVKKVPEIKIFTSKNTETEIYLDQFYENQKQKVSKNKTPIDYAKDAKYTTSGGLVDGSTSMFAKCIACIERAKQIEAAKGIAEHPGGEIKWDNRNKHYGLMEEPEPRILSPSEKSYFVPSNSEKIIKNKNYKSTSDSGGLKKIGKYASENHSQRFVPDWKVPNRSFIERAPEIITRADIGLGNPPPTIPKFEPPKYEPPVYTPRIDYHSYFNAKQDWVRNQGYLPGGYPPPSVSNFWMR